MDKPYTPILNSLKQDKKICRKYNHPGIYSISIAGKLVYIGKSRDMLCRLAQHIFYTQNLAMTKSHKYYIFALAQLMGYEVKFDTFYIATGTEEEIDDEIGWKEGQLIRKYLPPLNYQIPKENNYHSFTINKRAKSISLLEILGNGEKSNINNFGYSWED